MYNNYKIYIHKLKKDNRVYIGITKQRPKKRWQNGFHWEFYKGDENKCFV